MISIENFVLLMSAILIVGALILWRHGTKCYDKGITDAILMHRNGRLTYKDYLDGDGKKMVDIEIEPIDED
tara:strand:+ start:436 stop:648 length:213 start_codon:yes stop_codon:yes gene_type:complete